MDKNATDSLAAAPTSAHLPAAKYTGVAMTLHWIVAVLILINVALALSANNIPDSLGDWVRPLLDTHKSIGITVLGLGILRLLWRFSHRPPPLPGHFPRWEKAAAHATHFCLYLLILGLPLSGWMHDSAWSAAATHPIMLYGTVPFPHVGWITHLDPEVKDVWHRRLGAIHVWFSYALYALLSLHILGALKHQWIDRHSVLKRMLP